MGGGAWPFLVGGVICLVNSDNERDLSLLNSPANRLYIEEVPVALPLHRECFVDDLGRTLDDVGSWSVLGVGNCVGCV
jgi:hypothetical protein